MATTANSRVSVADSQEMVTLPYLPDVMLAEIFSRLPAKSIGRLRCLSKPWRKSLSTPWFIKSHLAHQKTRQQVNLILVTKNFSVHSIETLKHENVSRNLDLPGIWSKFSGSCDGLVLLANSEFEKLLLNPITMEHMIIPNSPLAFSSDQGYSNCGFGYDSLSDDYKVVTLSLYNTTDNDNDYDPRCTWTHVEVYSMKNGVWKRVKVSPYNHTMIGLDPGVFINGALHWVANIGESEVDAIIAAFDLAGEVFGGIAGPSGLNFDNSKLVVLGGCLCMTIASPEKMDVWIMKEYGLVESWMRFSAYDPDCEWASVKVLCFFGEEEEVVWITREEGLVVYYRRDNTYRELVVDGLVETIDDGGTFVESLVSIA